MLRMTAHRTALAATALTPLLLTVWAAGPVHAHGAPTDPVSRVFGCSPEGGSPSRSSACRAAVAANGAPFTAWDNLRIADVNGRDRQTIPDGKLCSGGLPAYKGLDLARADWPSTRLTPGGTLTMRYVSTIPHTGTFRLYLTKAGYDPAKPLKWSDLPEKPFAEVKDPALTDGAYGIRAKLPADRTGRHVLYTIWQNSSTPDTYYSCSDVVFPGAASGAGEASSSAPAASAAPAGGKDRTDDDPSPNASGSRKASASPAEAPADAGAQAGQASGSTPVAANAEPSTDGASAPLLAGGAAAVLLLTGGTALALRLRRR
ncbi:lytic polysaccharide monooxygenase [Streptomyces luteolifulvus]|jgi:chitin-binding protein|uniref:Lytic polysaccharide monooxygenase n=1 Tax=Streptomyces luteolifulvus TaxID=2615112 RepID=A0A6H9V992_9ACTN|nr:lytic polysaccharide monooxygenase [Streptomyces luteolifulvus]KAB1150098.1 lytic polysaccharide monooxygenase [Streptomyces luteolifulvus]